MKNKSIHVDEFEQLRMTYSAREMLQESGEMGGVMKKVDKVVQFIEGVDPDPIRQIIVADFATFAFCCKAKHEGLAFKTSPEEIRRIFKERLEATED